MNDLYSALNSGAICTVSYALSVTHYVCIISTTRPRTGRPTPRCRATVVRQATSLIITGKIWHVRAALRDDVSTNFSLDHQPTNKLIYRRWSLFGQHSVDDMHVVRHTIYNTIILDTTAGHRYTQIFARNGAEQCSLDTLC